MFSVKHVTPSGDRSEGKSEAFYMGDHVLYTEGKHIAFGPLEVRKGDCLVAALWGGTAYVMNETGKTINVYHLRDNEQVKAA